MNLDGEISTILNLIEKSRSARESADAGLEQLQKKILNGESTGDRITDFVIVHLWDIWDISGNSEKPYREVDEILKGQEGNQIMVVQRTERESDLTKHAYDNGFESSCFPRPTFTVIDTTLQLGVLTGGLEFDIQEGKVVFPTEKHVRSDSRFGLNEDWELGEGAINLYCHEFEELSRKVSSGFGEQAALAIRMGEGVGNYFRGYERTGGVRDLDLSYVKALNLLGQEVPRDFKEAYDKQVYSKRVGVIDKLEELTSSGEKLKNRINAIYNSRRAGSYMEGGALTIVETEDDAAVVSFREREELGRVKKDIRAQLQTAIELGLHSDGLRLERGPGKIIETRDYILGLCQQYEVKVPG